MRAIGVPTRADIVELVNQIGGLSKSYILDLQPENSMVRYAEEIARPAIADWTRRHSANRRTSTAKENGDRHTARATAA